MDEKNVREQLTRVFRTVLNDQAFELEDHVTDWDSITYINLIVAAERSFGITFDTRDIHQMTTGGRFVSVVVEKTRSRGSDVRRS